MYLGGNRRWVLLIIFFGKLQWFGAPVDWKRLPQLITQVMKIGTMHPGGGYSHIRGCAA